MAGPHIEVSPFSFRVLQQRQGNGGDVSGPSGHVGAIPISYHPGTDPVPGLTVPHSGDSASASAPNEHVAPGSSLPISYHSEAGAVPGPGVPPPGTSNPNEHVALDSLLPASYRCQTGPVLYLAIPHLDIGNSAFLEQELNLRRLDSILSWLWVAGRPDPPRPLHYQLVLGREIVIAERMDLHLVWTSGRIFLKPLPRFLLEPSFWREYLSCDQDGPCPRDTGACRLGYTRAVRARALGFLLSYTALISYESDFAIAKKMGLLPSEIEWLAWRKLVGEILGDREIDKKIDRRFIYGELRLSRLNMIHIVMGNMRGYMTQWHQYGDFFRDNLTWLASATVYAAIVLTAMQVGFSTSLARNQAFQSVSYGFVIFSLVSPPVVASLVLLAFSYMFVGNWLEAVRYKNKRFDGVKTGQHVDAAGGQGMQRRGVLALVGEPAGGRDGGA